MVTALTRYGYLRRLRYLLATVLLCLLSACGGSPAVKSPPLAPEQSSGDSTLDKLYQQYQQWRGTPYRLGGDNHRGIDCSAFVQRTFLEQFGITLPRTTSQQVHAGFQINKSDLQPGDLVFFRFGHHVGIYLDDDKFLHASTRLGVTISDMHNVYWSHKYWRSIRVKSLKTVP
jgi:cell wall-associated NlpC family hydrolase